MWKDIEGYEGLYQINNKGEICRRNRILAQKETNGYKRIGLCKNGKVKDYYVHRLVAETFMSNPLNKRTINHKNGIKSDNIISNLEWATHSENNLHSYRVLNRPRINQLTAETRNKNQYKNPKTGKYEKSI